MTLGLLSEAVLGATSATWAGVIGLVAAGVGAAVTATATAAYARRSREARAAVVAARDDFELAGRHADRSHAELADALERMWRQREVLTRALTESEPGESSVALAGHVASLDQQLALLTDELRHARAVAESRRTEPQAGASPAEPHGQA
jgi:hypothetical protein